MPPRKDKEGELLQGTLDLMVLRILTRGALHGYDISDRIRQSSEEVLQVEEGALYPALHRLELRGLLDSEWGVSENNRRAKFYKLTAEGRRHLHAETERWSRLSDAVNRVLRTA